MGACRGRGAAARRSSSVAARFADALTPAPAPAPPHPQGDVNSAMAHLLTWAAAQ